MSGEFMARILSGSHRQPRYRRQLYIAASSQLFERRALAAALPGLGLLLRREQA